MGKEEYKRRYVAKLMALVVDMDKADAEAKFEANREEDMKEMLADGEPETMAEEEVYSWQEDW